MTFKHLKLLVPLLLLVVSAANAQRVEKFDILTFTPPAGWEAKKTNEARTYSTTDEKTGIFCIITLVRSMPSQGSSRADFELIWKMMVADELKSANKPEMGGRGLKQGWMGELGVAPIEVEGLKGAAMMTTLTGNGMMIAVLALTNSDKHEKDIEAFIDGITLPLPVAEKAAAGVTETNNSRLIGKWNRSGSMHPTYADPASWGTAGYTTSRYEFKDDGTYLFTERTFRMMHPEIFVVKETGKYSVNGGSLTVAPAKSVISSYKKAGGTDALGALVKSQPRDLKPITYTFGFHFFEGIKEWNLVLQADKPTQRDGAFSENTTFRNAWYFDQKFTDNDLTSIKGN